MISVTMTVLFFLAKKRQWKIKEGLRRSARKVTSAVKAVTSPLTPKKMTFSPIERKQRNEDTLKRANSQISRSKPDGGRKAEQEGKSRTPSSGNERDLEKGLRDVTIKVETKTDSDSTQGQQPARKDRKRPRPPSVTIPSSAFEMDSPKTPVWKKMFGR